MKKTLHHCFGKKALFTVWLLAVFTWQAKAGGIYLKLNGTDTVIIEQGRTFNDPGATAYDTANNVIANANIVVTSPNSGYNMVPGTYIYKYNYSQQGMAAKEIYRTIIVIPDSTKPELTILNINADRNGVLRDTVAVFETYTAPQATAQDIVDGNLSGSIMVNNTVNTNAVGIYSVTYTVADVSKNITSKEVMVHVVDTVAPVVTILGPDKDTVYLYTFYNDPGVNYSDNADKNLKMTAGGSFYQNFPDGKATVNGNYTIAYKVCDASENCTSLERSITVIDTVPTVSGTIYLSGFRSPVNIDATVYLIKYNEQDSTLTAVDSIILSSSYFPIYNFSNIQKGKYLVKAALRSTDTLYSQYLPTYYISELSWSNATTVTVDKTVYNVDILLLAGTNTGGPGFISGKVLQGANKKEGDPLENIQILLTTADDIPVAYTYSDENGYFEFGNLPLGTYKLFGEVAGKKALGREITLTTDATTQNRVAVVVNSTSIETRILPGSGINNQAIETGISVYPNPANSILYISSKTGLQLVRLYTTEGRLVNVSQTQTSNNIILNTALLPQGLYLLEITQHNQTPLRKKIIVAH